MSDTDPPGESQLPSGVARSIPRDEDAIVGLCEQVEQFVAERPLKALALAFLAGLALSRFLL